MVNLKRIFYTPGEPAGIGADLIFCLEKIPADVELIIVADPQWLAQRAKMLGKSVEISVFDPCQPVQPSHARHFSVVAVPLKTQVVAGQLDQRNSEYVLDTLRVAVAGCMDGTCHGMVTGPVHKGIINDAGFPFTGHTEFLAELTDSDPVMMLATEGLRVALATTHLPLRDVPDAITAELLERVLVILNHDLIHRFGVENPRILVAGLNPHAGEGGYLGREELDIINPLLEQLRKTGMRLEGCLPADTLFTPEILQRADAVLAMYHDQGLTVLKHKGFGRSVNITLGLPINRTSVDHGTALDLAGTGRVSVGSLETALETVLQMKTAPCFDRKQGMNQSTR